MQWRPREDLEPANRLLVALEQDLLAVFQGKAALAALRESVGLASLWDWVDRDPHQAVLLTRIKSGHAMTPRHGLNVMMLARAWARFSHKLGSLIDEFAFAALVHDLGHWRSGDLLYVFDPFTFEQFGKLKTHPMLEDEDGAVLSANARRWIAQHHEQPDGRGYPAGIRDAHPLSQMLRVCDVYEGLTTPRRFRNRLAPWEAVRLMGRWAGFRLDAGLMVSFRNFMGTFPAGTFVRLPSGDGAYSLPPRVCPGQVLVVSNAQDDVLAVPEVRELGEGEAVQAITTWREPPLKETWRALRPDMMGLPRFY